MNGNKEKKDSETLLKIVFKGSLRGVLSLPADSIGFVAHSATIATLRVA